MACKNCETKPVIILPNSAVSHCKQCFFKYFEKKVNKVINQYKLIEEEDHIGVAVSGGKDSTTLLYLLNKHIKKRRGIKLSAIAIDEGIQVYRDKSLDFIKKFCKEQEVDLKIFSYEKEFGKSLDNIMKTFKGVPCSVCGVFRRNILNKKAKELNFTKLATGHNLDDEAQTILMNYFRRNIKASSRLGPITGVLKTRDFVKRIKPLYFLTEKEIATYAFLKGFMDEFNECPYSKDSYRNRLREVINDFDNKYPGTKYNIIYSFLEILPLLKSEYKNELNYCKTCGEPCSRPKCKSCEYVETLIKP